MKLAVAAVFAFALLSLAAEEGLADEDNPAGVADAVIQRYEARTYEYTGGPYEDHVFPYRLLKPRNIEAGREYPLVVFLHGAGERGDDNIAQLKYFPSWMSEPAMRSEYPCFVLAPQCPKERRWGSLDFRKDQWRYTEEPIAEMEAVLGMLERTMKNQPIDADRVYLTGLSMGGYGSWELAAREPGLFAAVAPICGAGDTEAADRLTDIPLWAWHGDQDGAVPVERSREMIEAIKKAGGEPRYTELEGVGHNSWTPAYQRGKHADGLIPWMFEQRRGK